MVINTSKVVFTRPWNNAGGVIDIFRRVKKFFHLQVELKLGFQGHMWVEKGSGRKAFQSRKARSEVRRHAPAVVLPPARHAPCMGGSGPLSGIECRRCASYTFSGECHIQALWYLPQAFLWLFPWLLCSDTFPETNSWVHTQLFKQTWLPYSFVCLFILTARHSLWDFSSLVRDWTQGPWQWKHGVLTIGPRGNSHIIALIINYLMFSSFPDCCGLFL